MTISSTATNLPSKEKKSTGIQGVLNDTREFMRISKLMDGLVPLSSVGIILGVSRQRVHQLVTEGTFSHWTFYGMKWLSQSEVIAFAKLNRRAGENQHNPSAKQMWKAALESGDEFTKKRRTGGY